MNETKPNWPLLPAVRFGLAKPLPVRESVEIAAHNNGMAGGRIRLDFIDGLRGLMALWVIVGHIVEIMTSAEPPKDRVGKFLMRHAHSVLFTGLHNHFAVVVFIVLSGFCLTIPLVRSPTLEQKGGAREFFRRRARRILPPFYGAFIVSVLLSALSGWAMGNPVSNVDGHLLNVSYDVYAAHLILVQNLDPSWLNLNYPLWSIATEWQVYFFLPLLLLPVARRWGLPMALCSAFVAAQAVQPVVSHYFPGNLTMPWFVGLFAMGMMTAALSLPHSVHRHPPQRLLPISVLIICACLLRTESKEDYIVGLAACLIIAQLASLAGNESLQKRSTVHAFLESRWIVALGGFSYSLYLVHLPVMNLLGVPFVHLGPTLHTALIFLLLPVILGFSYIFHLAFERPFMNLKPSAVIQD